MGQRATPESLNMNGSATRIVVVDLRIPFFRLVMFFVKATLAAIPAAIIVGALIMVITAGIVALTGGNASWLMQRWTL
jgi:hypothetical protein